MMRGFKEPFLQLILLVAAVLCIHFLVSRATYPQLSTKTATPTPPSSKTTPTAIHALNANPATVILITRDQIQAMAEGFARNRQRPPTNEELEGLIQERVRKEVYYREGLDRDDPVTRQQLRQKLERVGGGQAVSAEPDEAELQAYLDRHREKFRLEPRYTFRQVYLDPKQRRSRLADDAARLLAQLREAGTNAGVSEVGDYFRHGPDFLSVPASEVTKELGEKFAAKLVELPPGRWQGPIDSAYGTHLVFLSQRTESRDPALAEVRETLRREWTNAPPPLTNDDFYRQLLKRYTVIIERTP